MQRTDLTRRLGRAVAGAVLLLGLAGPAGAADDDRAARWQELREVYFGDRPVEDGGAVLAMEAPKRAHDAALVPIEIEALVPQNPNDHIAAVHLIVDGNPVPLAGVFRFTPFNGRASIATRVRVNSYTDIHAVAEMNDGRLFMVSRFVKAAGGCSAPALKDPEAALARLGRMKLNLPETVAAGEPVTAQLLISHPNNTGMQFDQITRTYVPPHYIRTIRVAYDGVPVLEVDADISLSEDPSIHFSFVPTTSGTLTAEVLDSKDATFEGAWPVSVQPGS